MEEITIAGELVKTGADVGKDMLAVLGAALGVFALQWGVRKVIRFFKSATN